MTLANDWWQKKVPLTVGSLGSLEDIKWLEHHSLPADLLELRLDLLYSLGTDPLEVVTSLAQHPLLITARCPSEGGHGDLTTETRLKLLEASLPYAKAIDIEICNLDSAKQLVIAAKSAGICVVGSFHDFIETPNKEAYQKVISKAEAAEVDVIKCAAKLHDLSDLQRLLDLFKETRAPLSIMGMGKLGPTSRVILAQHGSLLNYGYIGHESTAPGQWPVELLKKAITASL